jgi:hypothetical protein
MQSCNPQNSSAEPMSLQDRIERIGRALTAEELAGMLTVSRITIFKQAKAGRTRRSASAPVYDLTRSQLHNGCGKCEVSGDSSPRSGIRPKRRRQPFQSVAISHIQQLAGHGRLRKFF